MRAQLFIGLVWLCAACGTETTPRVYPEISDLPSQPELPDPFRTFFTDEPIETAEQWKELRRPELRDLFAHYIYGFAPAAETPVGVATTEVSAVSLMGGTVLHDRIRIDLADDVALYVAVFRPTGVARPPVFVALNPCGNHSLLADEQVRRSESWAGPTCPLGNGGRAGRAERWPIAAITARGYALATVHESDIDPDDQRDDRFADGVHPHFAVPGTGRVAWGRIAAWAWGLSRVVDALSEAPHVDGSQIMAVGHSRRGKAALLAAALDERIALAIPHQSGTAGATATRGSTGETVWLINSAFPNWFNDIFPEFADQEARLPIDQHLLLAQVAPRPLLVTNGAEDAHADPASALRAVLAAKPVYELVTGTSIATDENGVPPLAAPISWHQRPGGHALLSEDWETFMTFADLHVR